MASSSAGAGGGVPPEITAEWTVHAQLTLSHQGSSASCDKLKSEGGSTETNPVAANDGGAGESPVPASSGQRPPVKVIYKFSTPRGSDGATVSGGNYSPVDGGGVTFKQDGAAIFTATDQPSKTSTSASADQSKQPNNEDVSIPVPVEPYPSKPSKPVSNLLAPPQTLTAMTSQLFPQCTSTCSIVLTADLLPTAIDRGEPFISVNKCASTSTVFNTADKFTSFPEMSPNGSKIFEARDVSCQTSDVELTKDKTVQTSRDDLRSLPQRAAEALMSPDTVRREEKYGSLTRKSPISPADILSPSNTLQSQRSSVKDGKKKPRTVHIDVYCTGSDAESSSSADSSSRSASPSSASGSRFDTSHLVDIKSNSNVTHPTVFESEEMKLRHKRAGKHEVPRRFIQQTVVDQSTLSTVGGSMKRSGSQNRRSVKRSNTKDEINESKQMLFNKILGEPKEAETFGNLEYLARDPSDDNISSNYPFSNRSTKRDVTGSSLSSALASAGFEDIGDLDESASGIVNLNRSGTVVTHSDSFEYANSEDRYRIHQMERVWGDQTWKSPSVERKLLEIHNPKFRRHSESDNNLSESDHSFVYDSPSRPNESVHSDSSPSTVKSNSNRAPLNANASKRILQHALLNANGSSTFPPRTLSPVEGYTSEYMALARRFGSLITGKRKPGVHMGPVRNPECQCEHCRRWMLQRDDDVRERAMSVDDTPSSIVDMRRKLHLRNYAVLP